jgi:hypothetical protein
LRPGRRACRPRSRARRRGPRRRRRSPRRTSARGVRRRVFRLAPPAANPHRVSTSDGDTNPNTCRRGSTARTDWRSKRTRCRTRPAAPRRIPVRCGGRSGIRLLPQGLAPFHDFCATTYDRSSSVTAHAWSDDGRPTPTDLSRSGSTPAKTPTAEDRRRVHRPGCRRRPAIPAEHARAIYREGSGDHDLDR